MDLPDPCFVKMDIEGSEAKALRGMRERLRRAHPVLLIAIHGDASSRADVLQQRIEFSYRIAWGAARHPARNLKAPAWPVPRSQS